MPELPSDPALPWLDGMIVCDRADEAEAVRALLHGRGLRTRSVPSGRARLAWTCADGERIWGVVVSGAGAEAARASATYWMLRARRLVVLGITAGTGATPLPATALEGAEGMRARARGAPAAGEPPALDARIEAAASPGRSAEARRSLADAGIAATLAEAGVWREAAARLDREVLVVAGLHAALDLPPGIDAGPQGQAGRPPVARTLSALLPRRRASQHTLDAARAAAAAPAARCALAALGAAG